MGRVFLLPFFQLAKGIWHSWHVAPPPLPPPSSSCAIPAKKKSSPPHSRHVSTLPGERCISVSPLLHFLFAAGASEELSSNVIPEWEGLGWCYNSSPAERGLFIFFKSTSHATRFVLMSLGQKKKKGEIKRERIRETVIIKKLLSGMRNSHQPSFCFPDKTPTHPHPPGAALFLFPSQGSSGLLVSGCAAPLYGGITSGGAQTGPLPLFPLFSYIWFLFLP